MSLLLNLQELWTNISKGNILANLVGAQAELVELTRNFNLVPHKMNPVYTLHKVNQCMERGNLF